jgi:predicted RNase H-related nuclease YkuK (DUF458 family)
VDILSKSNLSEEDLSAIREIINFIKSNRRPNTDWVIGCSRDPILSLFAYHNVLENGGKWFYKKITNVEKIKNVMGKIADEYKLKIYSDLKRVDDACYIYTFEENVYTLPKLGRSF